MPISRVFQICNAYESGFGHGLKKDGLNGEYSSDAEWNEAYKIGYEGGEVASEIGIDNIDCICGVSHISGANSRPAVVCSQCNGVIKQG